MHSEPTPTPRFAAIFAVVLAAQAASLLMALTSDLYAGGMLESTADVDRAMSRIGSESERLYRLADDMLQLARHGTADEPAEIL